MIADFLSLLATIGYLAVGIALVAAFVLVALLTIRTALDRG